jgi:hypothetical protein
MASWKQIIVNASNSVVSSNITDGAITTAKIANDAVTNGKIADEAIDNNKLADNAVTASAIGSNQVTSAKIASSAVTTAKIANDAITNAKIADFAVTGEAIADEGINSGKLADNSVGENNIATGAVTRTKIANDAIRVSQIDTSNGSVPGYYLQASQTTEGLSWVQAPTAHNYVVFKHNFSDNLDTNEHYLPWSSTGENTSPYVDNVRFVVPFDNMKFRRLVFQYETLQYSSITATFDLKSSSNGSTTITTRDTVNRTISSATTFTTYTIDDGTSSSQLNYTASVGEALYLSVDFSLDPYNTTRDFYATSIWELDGSSIG